MNPSLGRLPRLVIALGGRAIRASAGALVARVPLVVTNHSDLREGEI
jgi:hypothetical protein